MVKEDESNRMTPIVEDRTLVLERVFDAPRSLVFKAFSEAGHLTRWWGPKGWTLPVCNMDFRPGGVWHYCMRSPDGQMESWGKAVYREIVEPERIVYVDYFADAEGNAVEGMPEALIEMIFVDLGGRTKLISRTQYPTANDIKSVLDMGLIQGIAETWDRLAELLEEIGQG